jgi:hypothetical protein
MQRQWLKGLLAAVVVLLLAYLALDLAPLVDKMAAPLLPLLAPSLRTQLTRFLPRAAGTFSSAAGINASSARAASSSLLQSISTSQATPQTSSFSTSLPLHNNTMAYDKNTFKEAVELRRSIYTLNKNSPIPDSRIREIAETAVLNVPSSFNSQSARLVVLLKDEHDKFWDIVRDALKAIVPPEQWDKTAARIQGFRNAYGTVRAPRLLANTTASGSSSVALTATN